VTEEPLQFPALVLAGGKAKPDLFAVTGQSNRALVSLRGQTMLDHVVDALSGAGCVSSIVVTGNVPDSPRYRVVADHGGFVENIFAGLQRLDKAPRVLICTSDIPFITAEVIEDFCIHGHALRADMVYPIVAVETCLRKYPGMKRTALSLREGRFTGGNMVLVNPDFMHLQRERIARAYAARKSPLRLALMLGIGTTIRVALAMTCMPRVLSIRSLEESASRLVGGDARAYISRYPEIATDIDRAGDLLVAQTL
jgi:2-phospho-L-lactate guanylyltransferase (CobY/MobA/RfbA family)